VLLPPARLPQPTWHDKPRRPSPNLPFGNLGQESTSRTRKNDGTDPSILVDNLLKSSGKLCVKAKDYNVLRRTHIPHRTHISIQFERVSGQMVNEADNLHEVSIFSINEPMLKSRCDQHSTISGATTAVV
jgi:hypothetical protein